MELILFLFLCLPKLGRCLSCGGGTRTSVQTHCLCAISRSFCSRSAIFARCKMVDPYTSNSCINMLYEGANEFKIVSAYFTYDLMNASLSRRMMVEEDTPMKDAPCRF